MFVQKGKRSISFLCCLALLLSLVSGISPATAEPTVSKITAELQAALDDMGDGDTVPVYVWIDDVDHEGIEAKVAAQLGFTREMLKTKASSGLFNTPLSLGMVGYDPIYKWEEIIAPKYTEVSQDIDLYIKTKRETYTEEYISHNAEFTNTHLSALDADVIHEDPLVPMIICEVSKADVYTIEKLDEVNFLDLFVNSEIIPTYSRDAAFAAMGADTARNPTITGMGVKIGMIEPGVPWEGIAELDYTKVFAIGGFANDTDDPNRSDHASLVAALIVGEHGMAPDAELFSIRCNLIMDLYDVVPKLLLHGVNVINMSAGNKDSLGKYTAIDQYIDAVVNFYDVTWVNGAGNSGGGYEDGSGTIISPGMAYNAITVGAVGSVERNDPNYNYVAEYSSHVTDSYYLAHKPDVVAPGSNLSVELPSGTYTASGTSFAAPHVAGLAALIAQLNLPAKIDVKTVKAAIMASCDRKAPLSYGGTLIEEMYELTDRQGAGVINVWNALKVVGGDDTESDRYAGHATETVEKDIFSGYKEDYFGDLIPDVPTAVTLTWYMSHTLDPRGGVEDSGLMIPDLSLQIYDDKDNFVTDVPRIDNNAVYLRFTPTADKNYKWRVSYHPYYSDDPDEVKFSVAWVSQPSNPLKSGINIPKTAVLAPGDTERLPLEVLPAGLPENISTTWESSDPTVATVDASGFVTALDVGNTTITATTKKYDGIFVKRSTVSVVDTKAPNSPKIEFTATPAFDGIMYTTHRANFTIKTPDPARVYYTTDGTMPTIGSEVYDEAKGFIVGPFPDAKSDVTVKIAAVSISGSGESEYAIHRITFYKPIGIDYEEVEIRVPGYLPGEEPVYWGETPDTEYWIDLHNETLILPEEFTPAAYSTDGGKKWKNIKFEKKTNAFMPITEKKHPLSKEKFPKLFGKDLILHISDKPYDKKSKQLETDAIVVKFEDVEKRPKEKYKVNYSIAADTTGKTTGAWLLTDSKGVSLNHMVQVGVVKHKVIDDKGFGNFHPTRDGKEPGILIEPKSKGKDTEYFIRTAPSWGPYRAAGKPKKIKVKNEQASTSHAIKNGSVKLKSGDYIFAGELSELGAEAVAAGNELQPGVLVRAESKITVDVSNISGKIYVWQGADKKPSSQKTLISR
ncbi:MAG: S8 family serine peptidase [Oscillospiraceae bacterium]|nr:S8 family serine peptidase [Oscillospiraceae bacterium]